MVHAKFNGVAPDGVQRTASDVHDRLVAILLKKIMRWILRIKPILEKAQINSRSNLNVIVDGIEDYKLQCRKKRMIKEKKWWYRAASSPSSVYQLLVVLAVHSMSPHS